MKRYVPALLITCCLFALPIVHADEKQADLNFIADQLIKTIDDGETVKIMQQIDLYKKAGLSYQSSLVLPLTLDNVNDEDLNILIGMHAFDANYAMVFGKMKESMDIRKFLGEDLMPRTKAYDKIDFSAPDQALVLRLLRDPNDDEARQKLNKQIMVQTRHNIEMADNDQDVLKMIVESYYGAAIQGLYVASTLSLDTPLTPEIVRLFEEQLNRLQFLDNLIHALESDTMREILKQEERCELVDAMIFRLSEAGGMLTIELIEDVQVISEKARTKYAPVRVFAQHQPFPWTRPTPRVSPDSSMNK